MTEQTESITLSEKSLVRLSDRVTRLFAEGWELDGYRVYSNGCYIQKMVKAAAQPALGAGCANR